MKDGNNSENILDVFIEGEIIDLCVPSKESWVINKWFRWFNKPNVTKYLRQGIVPNTAERQLKFYEGLNESDDRIALLIKPKDNDYFVGVASLSSIDLSQRQCDFAMVIGEQDSSPDAIFYGLEAKCRMTEHAFENIGVERINSGQIIDLVRWQKWQAIFGYQIEGIKRKSSRKGYKVYDAMISSCLLEDYLKLKELRNGTLWPGKDKMFELIRIISQEETMIDRLYKWLKEEWEITWEKYI